MRITAYVTEADSRTPVDAQRLSIAAFLDAHPNPLAATEELPATGLTRRAVFLPDALSMRLNRLAEESGQAVGRIYGRLARASRQETAKAAPDVTEVEALIPAGNRALNAAQKTIHERAMRDIAAGCISLQEASTGSGKGFAMAAIALSALEEKHAKKVVIAAPTVAVMQQNWREWMHLKSDRRVAFVLGRNQFVDPDAIRMLLDNGHDDAGVRAWVESGGGDAGNAATSFFRDAHPGICWLTDDLLHVAQDFPVNDVILDRDADSETGRWHTRLQEIAQDADIVFCTHAMVAIDNLLRSRAKSPSTALPDHDLLLIDEAHAFENAVANIASRGLALSVLRSDLARSPEWAGPALRDKASKALTACSLLMEKCRAVPEDHTCRGSNDDAYRAKYTDIINAAKYLRDTLRDLISKKASNKQATALIRGQTRASNALMCLDAIIAGFGATHLTFAPVRRYPTLLAGPNSVRPLMEKLWGRLRAAVLFSATLCLPDSHGNLSDGYTRAKLALPKGRANSHTPITQPWLFDVDLHLPGAASAAALMPPRRDASIDANVQAWCERLAGEVISRIAPTAKGGTLVLTPSLDATRRIAEALAQSIPERVIAASPRMPATRLKTAFTRMARDGARPIWVATGPAWTGLDLRDEQAWHAEDDLILTDLVITRLPFGINRSSTQLARQEYMGYRATLSEALILLRQGIGRLVRREGLLWRRLWVLDGRLTSLDTRAKMRLPNALLEGYKRRFFF